MDATTTEAMEVLKRQQKPLPSLAYASDLFVSRWNASIESIKQLDGYDDCNFYVKSIDGNEYLMKFFNGIDSANLLFLKGLGALLQYLKSACSSYSFPEPVLSDTGADFEVVSDCPLSGGGNVDIAIRVYKWVHGATLSAVGATPELLFQAGMAVGAFSTAMMKYGDKDQGFHRLHFWDGAHFVTNVKPFLDIIPDSSDLKDIIRDVFAVFERAVLPDAHLFPRSVVMGDCNDANIIVSCLSNPADSAPKVVGLIDFGDTTYSWSVLELSNALAYGLVTKFGQKHPILSVINIFAGFISVARGRIASSDAALTDLELRHLHTLACARLCTSVTMGLYSLSKDPSNEYLKLHAMPGQNALRFLASVSSVDFTQMLSSLLKRVQLAPISSDSDLGVHFTLPLTRLIIAEEEALMRASSSTAIKDETVTSFVDPTSGVVRLTFVTGNKKKLEEVVAILSASSLLLSPSAGSSPDAPEASGFPYVISSASIDLPELQGADPEVVAKEKCKLAAQELNGPVLTEDTSLCFEALKGLPGIYIKWFLERLGLDGLADLAALPTTLPDGAVVTNNRAYAQCIFTLCLGPGHEPIAFVGRCPGAIVRQRGDTKFGWDPIFQPDGFDQTFAELSSNVKNTISHRYKAVDKLRSYLRDNHESIKTILIQKQT